MTFVSWMLNALDLVVNIRVTCFNNQFYVLLIERIYRFHVILSVNSGYFLKQH
jgi:hypothetical protein